MVQKEVAQFMSDAKSLTPRIIIITDPDRGATPDPGQAGSRFFKAAFDYLCTPVISDIPKTNMLRGANAIFLN